MYIQQAIVLLLQISYQDFQQAQPVLADQQIQGFQCHPLALLDLQALRIQLLPGVQQLQYLLCSPVLQGSQHCQLVLLAQGCPVDLPNLDFQEFH